MSVQAIQAAKVPIRKELNALLKTLSNDSIQEQSNYVFQKLISLEKYQKSQRVGVYLSMPLEIQTDKIVEHIIQNGKECFIPRYNIKEMVMVKLKSLEDFKTLPINKWNIRQPFESDIREDAKTKGGLDLILIPGLGFSNKGQRLGRGKGYYDRYLTEMDLLMKKNGQKLFTIGLAFKEQIIPLIPTTHQDFVLNEIIYQNL